MSDAESDLSTPGNLPTDAQIESAIRKVVHTGVKEDGFTLKTARSRVEKELELPTDFFKNDVAWKSRSKDLVEAIVNESDEEPAEADEMIEIKTKPKPKLKPKPKAGTKRKSDDAPKAKPKRQKKSPSIKANDSEVEMSEAQSDVSESKASRAKPKPKPKPKLISKSEDTSALSSPPEEESEPDALKQNGQHTIPPAAEDHESDLSSVIDDAPPQKKRGSKTKSSSPTATSKSKPKQQKPTTKASTSAKPDLSPDEEEVKRLQSWLLKCGIRKLWHRGLAPYSTPKERIRHLKGMLEEVGMRGRFSAEKARQIKESRELAAELEAAREFNEQWGHEEGDEEDEEEASKARKVKREEKAEVEEPVKRRPRGLVDFGDSGEESD